MLELNKKGFTLAELVIAIALLSIALFGITGLFSRGVASARRAEKLTTATFLAQNQIEQTIATPYPELTEGIFEARQMVFENYERETTVTFIDPSTLEDTATDQDLKRVTVTVFYPTTTGEKTFSLSIIVTRQ